MTTSSSSLAFFLNSLLSIPSPDELLAMALPARKAVVRAFGDRGLRLEARALAMLTSHVEQEADKAAASKGMLDIDGVERGEGFDINESSSAAAAAAAAAADAALAKLLDAYEPGERDRCVSFEWLER